MPDLAMLDYFYGDEAEQFTFYRIPKATGEDAGQEELSEEEEAEQRRLYEEDNEDIPIEGDDDLVF